MEKFTAPQSKVIRGAYYESKTRILSVLFADRNKPGTRQKKSLRPKMYLYAGVPQPAFDGFKKARSKGKYFAEFIRPHYPSQMDVLSPTFVR